MWEGRMIVLLLLLVMMNMTVTLMCHSQGYLQTQHHWLLLIGLTTTYSPVTLQLRRLLFRSCV
jgi:hypothetical protein